jgi:alpha-ketoglutarate-dependent taurine dioxygenase
MDELELKRISLGERKLKRQKPIAISEENLIQLGYLQPGKSLPLLIQPAIDKLRLVDWSRNNKDYIENNLLKHGAILFRNFMPLTIAEFQVFIESISGDLIRYSYYSTPRTVVSGNIYTSTDYPADQYIPLHNEMSYTNTWPMRICFYCAKPAAQGGETPIANSRDVFNLISPKTKKTFIEKGIMYTRIYRDGIGLSWQEVFQTKDKIDVQEYCRREGIEYEWKDNYLKTTQRCHAVAMHPQTGETIWFNQAHLFHVSNLQVEFSTALLAEFGEDKFPRNAYYGDGSQIELSTLEEIRNIYKQQSVLFLWQQGDVLLLDNMLTAHGRMPFIGPREILVGMSTNYSGKTIESEKTNEKN